MSSASVPAKRCNRCALEKPLTEFSKQGKGYQRWCKECFKQYKADSPEKHAAYKQKATEGGYWRRYHASRKGVINALINRHNYPSDEAEALADTLLDPETRCGICGIPNKVIYALVRQNFSFPLGSLRQNRRLTPDNLRPGKPHRLEWTRILCRGCNSRRGANRVSDGDTLRWARRQWQFRLPTRMLWWLRTEPEPCPTFED